MNLIEMNNRRHWTEDERILLKKMVNEQQLSFKKMAKKFKNRGRNSIASQVYKLGLDYKCRDGKYELNNHFWKGETPITAYFAGFSTADASLATGSKSFLLSLNSKDKNLLEAFRKLCGFTGEIRQYWRKNKKKDGLLPVSTLAVSNASLWYGDLEEKWGIIPNKTFRGHPPIIDNWYLKLCWLIGVIDGDGCISKSDNKTNMSIGFVSSNKETIDYVKKIIDESFPEIPQIGRKRALMSEVRKSKKYNCYHYVVENIRAYIIFDYLRQIPLPKLSRKWNFKSAVIALERYKQKYPHLFHRKLIIPPEYEQYSMSDTLPYETSSESPQIGVIDSVVNA